MSLIGVKFLILLYSSQVFSLDKDWWKHSNMYEIYVQSFKDSNGDGWGDLKGIISKLDYLKTLGVDTVYMTPFHPSPMIDSGYDVSDYLSINPLFGTMQDFEELMRQLKKRDMKMIYDLVINHSSDQHLWFKKSVDRIEPYTDYYIWRDPKGYDSKGHPINPNNWCSFFGVSAWTWNEKRKQFYYHAFQHQQPDLNYRNDQVWKEMKKIIKFWLNKGVAGMRLDAVSQIFEDPSFEDEIPYDEAKKGKEVSCWELQRKKIQNLPDTFDFIHRVREYFDEYSINTKSNKLERALILETFGSMEELKKFYGNISNPGCHYTFNYFLEFQWDYLSPKAFNDIIDWWMEVTPNNAALNWMIDSHDRFRTSFKFIPEYVNVQYTLISLLPGVMKLYYGAEISMTLGIIRPHQRHFGWSEYSRTPMQWDGSSNAGFSSNSKTWLPVNPNYWRMNVKKETMDESSVYNYLKSLLSLRKTNVIKFGDFQKYILSDWVFVIKRSFEGQTFLGVLNLGTEKEKIRLDKHVPNLPVELKVHLTTANGGFKKGAIIIKKKKRSFIMNPMSAVILS